MSDVSKKDLKYLAMCEFGAGLFSTCAKRQYMAIVLDEFGRVSGMGYNGSPPGQAHCVDGACPRMQEGSESGTSYDNCISVHAEQNAIMYSAGRHTIYVNGQPCSTCAKLIAGAGFKRVVCIYDPSYVGADATLNMLKSLGIEVSTAEYREVIACAAAQTMVRSPST